MRLKYKVVLLLAGVLVLHLALSHMVNRLVVQPSFLALERDNAAKDIRRCADALDNEIAYLSTFCADWAAWEDTYTFVDDGNEAFKKANLVPETLKSNKLNMVYIIALSGRVAWGEIRDLESEKTELMPLSQFPAQQWPLDHPLLAMHEPDQKVAGILLTDKGPMAATSHTIIHSDHTGPVKGWIIMGRLLSAEGVRELAARTQVALTVWTVGPELGPRQQEVVARLQQQEGILIEPVGPDTLDVFTLQRDIKGQPALLLEADIPRLISARGKQASLVAWLTSLGGGTLILLLLWVLMHWVVVKPLIRLRVHARRMGKEQDLSARLDLSRRDEIGDVCRSFDDMMDRLARSQAQMAAAARTKGQFIANISHELRTPLNGVVGMVELLMGTNLDQRQRKWAQIARYSASVLLRLINDVLDFSKLEAGRVELLRSPFDVSRLVEDLAEAFSYEASRKDVELICRVDGPLPCRVMGDEDRLRQVLTNLLGNAIKFTHRGEVTIACTVVPVAGGATQLDFRVRDTGIGIPAERIEHIFRGFSQADASTTRKYGGTGLGLAISRRLVEMLGGRIELTSQVGKGTEFRFSLRLDNAPVEDAAPVLPERLQSLRTLVVEGHPAVRDYLQDQLAGWGVAVEPAGDGGSALEMLQKAHVQGRPFEMVFVDMALPDGWGLELARQLASGQLGAPTVIAITSTQAPLDSSRQQELGLVGQVVKPVRRSMLLDLLLALSGQGGQQAQAPPVDQTDPRQGAAILLAEDNEINQAVATAILTRGGYRCEVVGTGRAAVEAVVRGSFDLVLMDCHMPELDGYEATRAIRQWEEQNVLSGQRVRRVPIVALTADTMPAEKQRCLDAGMDAFVSKPVIPMELLAAIQRLLSEVPGVDTSTATTHAQVASLEAAPPDDRPPFDIPSLRQRCMGDEAFVIEILGKFRDRLAEDIERIADLLGRGDLEQVARFAHSLKGASANVSAVALAERALDLERLARAGNAEHAMESFVLFQQQAQCCLEAVPRLTTA